MYERIPDELKKLNQWGNYHRIWVEKRGKYTKIPLNPWTGEDGKSNDPSTWSDFDTALRAINEYPQADGLAFYFANGYVGLDIDHIKDELDKVKLGDRDPENYVNKAHELTKGTYMEISMSGEGIHCIFKGKIPGDRRRKGNYEMYQSGRFFALTGNCVNSKPEIKSLNDDEMKSLYDHYFASKKVLQFPTQPRANITTNDLSVREVIERAESSSTGQRFKLFMNGGWERFYPSQSEADLAFANDLAFWTGRDFQQMDTIFRQSSLMRPKYDSKRGKTTYGIALLNKAINETSDVFNPSEKPTFNYDMSFLKNKKDKKKKPARSWDDMGNALRFMDAYGDNFKYSYVDKSFYYYNGSYWEPDQMGVVEKCADNVVANMKNEKLVISPGMDEDDARKNWEKFLKRSRSNRSKKNMLDELKHHIPVLHSDFDKESMLLNTKSGYVDLNSGVLKDHDREKMFSQQTAVEYTDKIDCPEWDRFLHQIFNNNEELIHYIQKAVGYSATGSIKEQVMFILYGNGRNGKSVFINTTDGSLSAKSTNPSQNYVNNSEYSFNGDTWTYDGNYCYFSDYEPTIDGSRKFGVRTYWGGSDWRKIPNGWHRVAWSAPEYFDTSNKSFSASVDITIANDNQNKWSDSWTDVCGTLAFYESVDDANAQRNRVGWRTLSADVHEYTTIQHAEAENVQAPDSAKVVCMEYWVNGSGSSGFNGWGFFQRPIIVQGDHLKAYVPNAVGGNQNLQIANGWLNLPYKGGWLDYEDNANVQMNGHSFMTAKGLYFQGAGSKNFPGIYTTRYGGDYVTFNTNSSGDWHFGKDGLWFADYTHQKGGQAPVTVSITKNGFRTSNINIGENTNIGTLDGQPIRIKYSNDYRSIYASSFNKASSEDFKKDIQPANLTDATNDILNLDLTTFRYKGDDVTDRKNIGAVIGSKYNLNHNLITTDGQGVVLDNLVGSLVGTVQRQAQQISDLNSKVTYLLLKGGYNNE